MSFSYPERLQRRFHSLLTHMPRNFRPPDLRGSSEFWTLPNNRLSRCVFFRPCGRHGSQMESDLKRAATIAPGSVWKARISFPPLTKNPRMVIGEDPAGRVNKKCTEQSLST
jgi:hypothetical protein